MGTYCKAYETAMLAEFPGWLERGEGDGGRGYLYLQEDFTVTSGIFPGESVVFDMVTPGWVEFCRTTLKFEVPSEEE